MNILIIDNSIAFTGAFKCALNAGRIMSGEHRMVYVVPEGSSVISQLKAEGHVVYTLPFREISRSVRAIAVYPFFLLKNVARLRRIVRKEHVDVIQVNDFYNLLGAAMRLTGYRGKLITYVRFLPSALPGALSKLWTFIAQKYSDHVVAVSDAVLRQLPSSPGSIRIYDPVNLNERLDEISKDDKTVRFLYLANFTRGKGQEYAIEAFRRVYESNSRVSLSFVGSDLGLAKNAAFRTELETLAEKKGLSDIISFHGFVQDIEQEIKSSDIVLNFSDAESFSMTCLEASFYGVPVIATRCGGPEEIIAHGETGLLVSCRDTDAMAAAMLQLAADKAMRTNYGLAAASYVRKKFDVETFKKAYGQIIGS